MSCLLITILARVDVNRLLSRGPLGIGSVPVCVCVCLPICLSVYVSVCLCVPRVCALVAQGYL